MMKFKRSAGVLAAAGAVLGMSAMLAPAATAADALSVSYDGSLTSGSEITVDLKGLEVGAPYYVGVCNGTGDNGVAPACDTGKAVNYASFTATKTTDKASFIPQKSFTAPAHGGGAATPVNCSDAATQCYVVITQHTPPYASAHAAANFN